MSDGQALRRLQAFLRLLAAALFAGTVAELLMAKHFDGPVQLIPSALCGVALLTLAIWWQRPGAATVTALRVLMVVIALGGLLGVYQHVAGNLGFVRETRPTADAGTALVGTLTGRDPLLAPGILAVGAVLAIAGTAATGAEARAAVRGARALSAAGGRPSVAGRAGKRRPAALLAGAVASVEDGVVSAG
jgi:hypothetical protein